MAVESQDILTPAEVATLAKCSLKTVYRAIKSGDLVASGIGRGRRRYRITRASFWRWMDASVVPCEPKVPVLVKAGVPVTGSAASLRAIERDAA